MSQYRITTARRFQHEDDTHVYRFTIAYDRVIFCERAKKHDADHVGSFYEMDFEDVPFLVHVTVTNHVQSGEDQLEEI
jgi:hypothetical protein